MIELNYDSFRVLAISSVGRAQWLNMRLCIAGHTGSRPRAKCNIPFAVQI